MAKHAARSYPHPYATVFDGLLAAIEGASDRFEIQASDRVDGRIEVDARFSVPTWGENIDVQALPESPTSTRVEIDVAMKRGPGFGGRRARDIEAIFAALDAALPGGTDLDPWSDVPAVALDDEVPAADARWQPDLTGRHELRYWDGRRWTEHVADLGVRSTDPVGQGGA
jgi:hypothetical protein